MSYWHDGPQPGPSPEEVLEEARGQAFDAGYKAGLAEARAKIEPLIAAVKNMPEWDEEGGCDCDLCNPVRAALASLDEEGEA